MSIYLKTPFLPRWRSSTLGALLIFVAMLGLGYWQLSKHHQRMAYIEGIVAEMKDAPFVLTGAASDDAYADRIFHQARARGHFDFANQVAIKNKFFREGMGYHLVTPFLIDGSSRAVLVDRGWVKPEEVRTSEQARNFDEPQLTEIQGLIQATEESAQPPAAPQFWWFRIDVASIQRQLPYKLLPLVVVLTDPEETRTSPPFRNPPTLKLDPGAHFGYAVEWFIFAALLPFFYAWMVVRVDKIERKVSASSED